jgi:hypothetical protein
MEHYVQELFETVAADSGRIIFVCVGPSGSGKSHLAVELKKLLPGLSIHSLDTYRIHCNKGTYPQNAEIHQKINKGAIPMYRDHVLQDDSSMILLDNTHLKWNPDWSLPIQKALRDHYDIFPIVPPASEYLLHTCRSLHLGTGQFAMDTFRKMCARWPGYRLGYMLNRRISWSTLDCIFPLKLDSFSVNKMFHINWGRDGYLYVLDNYLGYVDRDMVIHVIRSGNYIKNVHPDLAKIFLRKDSLVHITLIPPGKMKTDLLITIAKRLVQNELYPPTIDYVGVHHVKAIENDLLFLTIAPNSNMKWKQLVDAATPPNTTSQFNQDGIHVTLGYTRSDIWGNHKCITPKWIISNEEWKSLPVTFDWTIGSKLTSGNWFEELQPGIENDVYSVQAVDNGTS